MEYALVTGATGLLGKELVPLLSRKFKVAALYRSTIPAGCDPKIEWLKGDVTLFNLGLEEKKWKFTRVYHLAGLISLNNKDREALFDINTRGTFNVLSFMQESKIRRLFHVSTAYVDKLERVELARNAYEESKWWGEQYIKEAGRDSGKIIRKLFPPIRYTIFRPSILISEAPDRHSLQGFLYLVWTLSKIHRRIELVRRRIEGTLRLPPIEPLFRIQGDPEGTLNLVSMAEVAKAIAEEEEPGTKWLTSPTPMSFTKLTEIIGNALLLEVKFSKNFAMSSIEAVFHRAAKSFLPYLSDTSNFLSDLTRSEVDANFIQKAIVSLYVSK